MISDSLCSEAPSSLRLCAVIAANFLFVHVPNGCAVGLMGVLLAWRLTP